MTLDLNTLMAPASLVVVGASPRENSAGATVLRSFEAIGYPGEVFLVNPRYDKIAGRTCYPSVSDLPTIPDAAFIGLPAEAAEKAFQEIAELGIRAAYLNASGFADGAEAGRELQDSITATAKQSGITVCGPNNTGLINFHDRVAAWTGPVTSASTGGLAIIAQSGSACGVLTDGLGHLGLAYAITCGNEAVVSAADYLAHVVEDQRVSIVVLFLETIRNPEGFRVAAERASALGKRVLVLKVGRSDSGVAAVSAHTGGLAGDDRAYTAYFGSLGIVQVADFDELIETAKLFHVYPNPPASRHVVAMTLSGGEAALAADLAQDLGVSMPPFAEKTRQEISRLLPEFSRADRNPLDAFGLGWDFEVFKAMIDVLVADPDIGVIVPAIDAPSTGGGDADWACEMAEYFGLVAQNTDHRFVISSNAGEGGVHSRLQEILGRSEIPYLIGMRESLVALSKWTTYVTPEAAARGSQEISQDVLDVLRSPDSTDSQLFAHLSLAGVPMVRSLICQNPEEAVAAASACGYPVALKGLSPGIAHKARLGLVRLNLPDEASVRHASKELLEILREYSTASGAASGLLVQPMVTSGGPELFVGARQDALGTVVVAGAGGLNVELMDDVAVRMGSVSSAEAAQMLLSTRIGMHLHKVAPPRGWQSLVAAVANFSQVASAVGSSMLSFEINPLILDLNTGDVLGVDVVRELPPNGSKLAYPKRSQS